MEVGLNYTNIIGNEPILHEICVDFNSESNMKQTHKKRPEKKKKIKLKSWMNVRKVHQLLG
jgi:Mg2+/Co2+ transporter CorB